MSDRHHAYTSKPMVIHSHSRDSSNDSRTSYSSRSSTEGHYSSSRSSMANGGYYEPSYSGDSREHKHRTADDPRKYVSSTTSHSGKIEVHHQNRVVYDEAAPKSGEASSRHYQETQRKHKSSHSSKHKYGG